VIDFVLQGLGKQALGVTDAQFLAVAVQALDGDALGTIQAPPEPGHG